MRKLVALASIVLALSAPVAPALAQSETGVRDPFVPLISPTVAEDGTTDPTAPVVDDGGTVAVDPAEPLPGTGSPAATWFGLAYVVIALGAGAIALARLFGPLRVSPR